MATSSAGDLRNFAIVGHASSGKTTLSEAMLACASVIGRMGNIAQGSTVSDYHVSEKQHQISTQTSLLHCTWMGKKLNILDTPGYLDFISEALAAVHVADFALVVVHARHGIGVGTERVWNCATDCGIPKVIVVNAVDKHNAHFDEVLADARAHYGPKVFPLNVPINPGPNFNQVLDVLRNEVVTYETDGHGKFREEPATGEWEDRATQLHRELIELIAESDDTFLHWLLNQPARLRQHQDGESLATSHRGPWKLIYYEAYTEREDAEGREKFLKSGAGRRFPRAQLRHYLRVKGFASRGLIVLS